jgi:maleylacetate reductase
MVTTERWARLDVPAQARFTGVMPHASVAGVRGGMNAALEEGSDGILAVGGGSSIDSGKAISAELGLPVVSIPTTYSGAEWTTGFAMRDPVTGMKLGGTGAKVAGIVYEPGLTLGLPPGESAASALNALAHCAEGLYARDRTEATDRDALEGARLISEHLPVVVDDGARLEARTRLLEGAMHAGAALRAGMGVGHAMAQALGGRYELSHGAMNAVCLPAALRFNADVARGALQRLGGAMGVEDPIGRAEALGRLAGPAQLRDYGVPAGELPDVAEAAAARAPAKANPRPAPANEILLLLRSVW